MTQGLPTWLVAVSALAFGLFIGSFLNVVAYRTPRRLSVVKPGSFCPSCQTPIKPFDNIPVVSWLVLRGRCRNCGQAISVRYLLVESLVGVLFALLALATGSHWALAGLFALAATVSVDMAIELEGDELPLVVPGLGTALGVAALVGAAIAGHQRSHVVGLAVGTAIAAVFVAARRGSCRAFLPAGAVMGWSGPIGTAVGSGVLALAWVVNRSRRRPDDDDVLAKSGGGSIRVGVATVAFIASVLSVSAALAAGSSLN